MFRFCVFHAQSGAGGGGAKQSGGAAASRMTNGKGSRAVPAAAPVAVTAPAMVQSDGDILSADPSTLEVRWSSHHFFFLRVYSCTDSRLKICSERTIDSGHHPVVLNKQIMRSPETTHDVVNSGLHLCHVLGPPSPLFSNTFFFSKFDVSLFIYILPRSSCVCLCFFVLLIFHAHEQVKGFDMTMPESSFDPLNTKFGAAGGRQVANGGTGGGPHGPGNGSDGFGGTFSYGGGAGAFGVAGGGHGDTAAVLQIGMEFEVSENKLWAMIMIEAQLGWSVHLFF